MAVTLTQFNNNLVNPSSWTTGNGGVGIFNANGDTGEQNRYVGTDPWGNSAIVWQTVPSGNGNADGGWNTNSFSVDQYSTYRFSVWVKRTSSTSGGTFYFGLYGGPSAVIHLTSNASEGNPYWDYRGTGGLTQNQWYLVVGHCYPSDYNGRIRHKDSGYYTVAGGTNQVAENSGNIPGDCKWAAGTTTGVHRTYHYYCGDSTTRLEFFMPRVDKIDGTEPSIAQLLAGVHTPQGITYSDGTSQVYKPEGALDNRGTDPGELIKVESFPASGTWYNPGASKVHVKLIGGGGGGAGYCESGGAGGYAEGFYTVKGVSSVAVTVGGGGSYAVYYAAGGDGGTTSFGGYLSASGGYGANRNYSHSGGHGGNSFGGAAFQVEGGAGCGHINGVGHAPASVLGSSGYFGGGAAHIRNHSNLGWTVQHEIYTGAPGSGGPANITDWGHSHPSGRGHSAGGPGNRGLVIVYSYK